MTICMTRTDRKSAGSRLRGIGQEIWPDRGPQRRRPGCLRPGRSDRAAWRKRRRQVHARLQSFRASFNRPSGQLTWHGQRLRRRCAGRRAVGGNRTDSPGMRLLRDLSIAAKMYSRWALALYRGGRVDRDLMNRRAAARSSAALWAGCFAYDALRDHLKRRRAQQVEIAKALTLKARLLIFDEPTAALERGGCEAAFRTDRAAEVRRRRFSSTSVTA